jgi:septal ring factor EnvC (AmiA/AmiB activator)
VATPHVRNEADPAKRPLTDGAVEAEDDERIIAKFYALFEAEIQGVKDEANLLRATVSGLEAKTRRLDERVSRLEEENVVLRASNEELQRELAAGSEITRSQDGQNS